jgi:hypothetical protein
MIATFAPENASDGGSQPERTTMLGMNRNASAIALLAAPDQLMNTFTALTPSYSARQRSVLTLAER